MTITQSWLKANYQYDAGTGVFTNKYGNRVGFSNRHGYVLICINKKHYRVHRLAWLWVHGEFPKGLLHHKDRVRSHNWIDNLEEGTNQSNNTSRSMQSNNQSGYTGVYYFNGKRKQHWYYEINKASKIIRTGRGFPTAKSAWIARQKILIDMGYAKDHGINPSKYYPSHKRIS